MIWLLHTNLDGYKICKEMGFSNLITLRDAAGGGIIYGDDCGFSIKVENKENGLFLHDLLKEYNIKSVVTRR